MDLPATLLARATRGPDWAAWLDALPGLVRGLLADWRLTVDGAPAHGETALVLPVRTDDARPAALKVTWPHWEAATEHLALQRWHGDGAVELLRADPHRWALLLERAHARDLTSVPVEEACAVVAGLYARLHVPAGPQYPALATWVAAWTDRLASLPRSAPVPHRFVDQAVALGRSLPDDAAGARLLHTDLHYTNVLAADREPWLAIDPKPLAGDPHYEVAPLLWNRWEEAAGDVRAAVRRRVAVVCDVAGLDEDRVRAWVVLRAMCNALWEIEDAGRRGTVPDARHLTVQVALAKAVQD